VNYLVTNDDSAIVVLTVCTYFIRTRVNVYSDEICVRSGVSMNRKKLSGCQYKKKTKERAEKITDILNRTQKVDAYFKPINENEEQVSISNFFFSVFTPAANLLPIYPNQT